MRTLYLDCQMGAAGDMLTAALTELIPDPDAFVNRMNALGIPGVLVQKETTEKCGIKGTHIRVKVHGEEEESADCSMHTHTHHSHEHSDDHMHDHHHDHAHHHDHSHTSLHDLEHLIRDHFNLPEPVKEDVLQVYGLIAEAESNAHGVPVSEIHFHEVGAMDAVADVVAVCLLLHEIDADEIVASPVHVGSGMVRCAHGILPVPAPATAYILKGVPIYGGSIEGELCTPTGAALLKHFVTRFGTMPAMSVQKIGYGMGTKDFPAANCVRAMLGERSETAPVSAGNPAEGLSDTDAVIELSCNLDDMTAEAIGFAMEQLLDGGALDVYTIPIGMKKMRPGTMLNVLCRPEEKDSMTALLFRFTTTIGIRMQTLQRCILNRRVETENRAEGMVRRKISEGYGVSREKPEYEDLARIAKEKGIDLDTARYLFRKE